MKKNLLNVLLIIFFFFCSAVFSQETEGVQTIKVKKESLFTKAGFDESEFKVIAFDKYGNPHEQAIKSFSIMYSDGKSSYVLNVEGNTFPKQTIDFLTKKRKEATKICLCKLKAADDNGHTEDLPPLCDIVIFPDCKKIHK